MGIGPTLSVLVIHTPLPYPSSEVVPTGGEERERARQKEISTGVHPRFSPVARNS